MLELAQELMTPQAAAKWFRRSISWIRQQRELLRVGGPGGQPLFHVRVCRAYVLGQMGSLTGPDLRRVQLQALASVCGVTALPGTAELSPAPAPPPPPTPPPGPPRPRRSPAR